MTAVGVTGAGGFIGSNLCVALERARHEVRRVARSAPLAEQLRDVDVVVHLAGVNRPDHDAEFVQGNVDYTRAVCDALEGSPRRPLLLFASSIHVDGDTPYGRSKRAAEEVLADFARSRSSTGDAPGGVVVYRLPNVFGKWCRPRYNSVVATFAHAIARGEPYEVHDREKRIRLVYVDDVVSEFVRQCSSPARGKTLTLGNVEPVYETTLGELARTFESFATDRRANVVPSFADPLVRKLFATFTASLGPENLGYFLEERSDPRGTLAEVIKSPDGGQVFVSVTRPGAFRGGHFHDTKIEKFLVLRGNAVIDFEDMRTHATWRVTVSGNRWQVVDIPPGVLHKITNVGADDLVTLFWANEIFDPQRPDTYAAGFKNA